MAWAPTHGIRHLLIEPGRPMQNGYIESCNGKFRDECLNEHWFETLAQARAAITAWRQDYNCGFNRWMQHTKLRKQEECCR